MMEKSENEKNGLIESQKSLYTKLRKINQLFLNHFSSLILVLLIALGFIVLWTYSLLIGQTTFELAQRYGLFGNIVIIIQTIVLFILIIQIGIQIVFYSFFIIRGNHSLKQVKDENNTTNTPYEGIIPYIANFYSFFNRYSKEKTSLSKLVSTFLLLNFISGFIIIFLFTRLLGDGIMNDLIHISMVILFLSMVIFWLMNFVSSIKIKKEIVKWENLFPKLEEWAKKLDYFSSNKSNLFDKEEFP